MSSFLSLVYFSNEAAGSACAAPMLTHTTHSEHFKRQKERETEKEGKKERERERERTIEREKKVK